MGQYYRIKLNNKVYDRTLNGQYTMAKLMEHSWWENPMVNTICQKIFKAPKKVFWVGDYAEDEKLQKSVWGDNVRTYELEEKQVSLSDKFLVNHTKAEYVDCNKYFKNSVDEEGWCIHPLPLLTAVGNGLGGGDYRGINEEYVGCWAGDLISVELNKPEDFTFIEKYIIFK